MNWEVSTILLWEILPSVNIYRKQMKKCFFPKIKHFCIAKMVANQEKISLFSDSGPLKLTIKKKKKKKKKNE